MMKASIIKEALLNLLLDLKISTMNSLILEKLKISKQKFILG